MKTILVITIMLGTLSSAPIFGADLIPAKPTVEQRFQEADISLAIAQYEKLQMTAFEIRLKLELEPPGDDKQRAELAQKAAMLREQAAQIRNETLKRAEIAAASIR
jgi:hypothetical protein